MDLQHLDQHIHFDPDAALEPALAGVPARWVVYLLADANDRPIQLLCVKNLRASLRRRLGDEGDAEPSKRVDYRHLVRRIYWRRVDSGFEADLVYLDVARQLFPATYRKLMALRPAWFVHVDLNATFPRYTRTDDPVGCSGELFGPLGDKPDAQKLVECLEDWFDLCRYHSILQQSPHGKACAYKEMGRCPAPCDGTVSLEQYRRLVRLSAQALADPGDYIRTQRNRMQQAAVGLKFEAAARIKAYIDSLSQLASGPFRHVRRMSDLRFVSLQRGPGARTAKLFLVTPTTVEPLACLLAAPETGAGIVQVALASEPRGETISENSIENFGVVTRHLFADKPSGAFIPFEQLNERTLAAAYRDVLKQKVSDVNDDEGIVREIQPAAHD